MRHGTYGLPNAAVLPLLPKPPQNTLEKVVGWVNDSIGLRRVLEVWTGRRRLRLLG